MLFTFNQVLKMDLDGGSETSTQICECMELPLYINKFNMIKIKTNSHKHHSKTKALDVSAFEN